MIIHNVVRGDGGQGGGLGSKDAPFQLGQVIPNKGDRQNWYGK